MKDYEIRPTVAGDIPHLEQVLEETGLFPAELLGDMLAPALAGDTEAFWLTGVARGVPSGLCYTCPEELADGVWNMLALGVRPGLQRAGLGQALVKDAEARLAEAGARLLIVETSGTESFAPARAFYAKEGYEQEARIRDFWAEGDDKVIFRKRPG